MDKENVANVYAIMVDQLVAMGVDRSDAEPAVSVGMKAWELALETAMRHTKLLEHSPVQELLALITTGYGASIFAEKCQNAANEVLPLINALKSKEKK